MIVKVDFYALDIKEYADRTAKVHKILKSCGNVTDHRLVQNNHERYVSFNLQTDRSKKEIAERIKEVATDFQIA